MMVLFLRASRTVAEPYTASTAVLLAEVLKLFTCTFLVLKETGSCKAFTEVIKKQVFGLGWETFKILVPACLYIVQNNLLFLALSKLDAATYQVTYQLKILTTAFFSVFLLQKHLDYKKWGSLVLLMIGVSIVQLNGLTNTTDNKEIAWDDQMVGLACVIGACLLSGLAGVYLEIVLKFSKPSVWVRNIQLSLFSLIPGLLAIFWTDSEAVLSKGFFYGYTPLVWVVIIMQACSGLIVALVVKYADNILKSFATSISIILSSVVAMVLFGFIPSPQWAVGSFIVISSTILYGMTPSSTPPQPQDIPVLPIKEIHK